MKAQKEYFNRIIDGRVQFQVPVFQRDYSWRVEHCLQLWEDIRKAADAPGNKGHFLGSIVYIQPQNNSAGFARWLLIDGQQRITTLTLLMTALRDHIMSSGWSGGYHGLTATQIDSYFLRNMQETGDRHLKLRLRNHDNDTLEALLLGSEFPEQVSIRIRDNYDFFREKLAVADPDQVYAGILKLMLVDVSLTPGEDDPQKIFASLNSTGKELSQSDLIRNFILMSLPEPEQTRLYDSYWRRLESLFRGGEQVFDNFIRDFLALRARSPKLTRSDKVHEEFRDTFSNLDNDVDEHEILLKELLRRARQYATFVVGVGSDEISRAFALLRHLSDAPAILIIQLLEAYEESKTLTKKELLEAVRLIESYLLRRAITGGTNKGYALEFAKLAYRIDAARPLASLKAALFRMPAAYAFPDDSSFVRSLTEEELYPKRVTKHVLDALENRDLAEQADTSNYSVEHIMPQNPRLNEAWRTMLGEGWQEAQRTWLHRLGNLTLTGYNSTYKDKGLLEKQTVSNGFRQSAIRLNQEVSHAPAWTPTEMKARGERLAGRALHVWPRLIPDMDLVRQMDTEELAARAARRNWDKIEMSEEARALFVPLRERLRAAFPDLIEMGESRSVSYHDPDFFLEVIPRRRGLGLLIAIEHNEVEAMDELIEDTSAYAFVVNAAYQGGVLITLREQGHIERAFPVIVQARSLVSTA